MKKAILQVALGISILFAACSKNDDANPDNGNGTDNPTMNSFTDSRDGTIYKTVTIGNQVWMAENLRYLPSVVSGTDGPTSATTPYYYVKLYNGNDVATAKETSNYKTYGVWYNWPAAMADSESTDANPSGVQGACPSGWHLPSDAEWEELENYLADNGYNYDGTTGGGRKKIAKALADSTGWPSMGGKEGVIGNDDFPEYRNKSGFSALPGGSRSKSGHFESGGEMRGSWWTATENETEFAVYRYLNYARANIHRGNIPKEVAVYVRCVKN